MSTETFLSIIGETYLLLWIVNLLAYGVIAKGGKVSHIKNMTNLSVLVLVHTLILEWCNTASESSGSVIKILVIVAGIVVLLASKEQWQEKRANLQDNEYNQIVLLAILGMILIVSARNMVMMYLAIETMSLSLYIMATLRKTGQYSTEAGLKYIVLGAISSGIILLGISQIYVSTGSVEWEAIGLYTIASSETGVELGALMIIVAVLFKLGVAPLHMWVPDVYEGAPTVVTMFFAVVPKLAIMSLLISLVSLPFIGLLDSRVQPLLIGTAIISIIVGSVGAINQTKIKRVLAYSAIAHMGWVVLGIGVGTIWGFQAAIIYMILYMVMGMNTFSIVLNEYVATGNNYIVELSGLARRAPVVAITFSLALLSIAGIPPLAGFYSKYNIIIALLEENWIITSAIGIVVSVIGAYYYIRIIQIMYFNDTTPYLGKELGDLIEPRKTGANDTIRLGIMGVTLYIIMTYLIYPNPIIEMSYEAIRTLIL